MPLVAMAVAFGVGFVVRWASKVTNPIWVNREEGIERIRKVDDMEACWFIRVVRSVGLVTAEAAPTSWWIGAADRLQGDFEKATDHGDFNFLSAIDGGACDFPLLANLIGERYTPMNNISFRRTLAEQAGVANRLPVASRKSHDNYNLKLAFETTLPVSCGRLSTFDLKSVHLTRLLSISLITLASASFCFGQSIPEIEAAPLGAAFAEYPEGCITVFDVNHDRWTRHNSDRCLKRFVPASTFKIVHSLIALETGVVDGPSHEMKWDGKIRSVDTWNEDHNLRTAVSRSVVWYFEKIAEKVPPKQMSSLLSASDYGNHKTSGKQPFWISGDLAVSADEQVGFLRKLHDGRLPFKRKAMDTVKGLITLEKTADYTLYGKTGWARLEGVNIGWFIGWIDTRENTFFFATNIQSKSADGFGQARKAITMDVLQRMGVIPQNQVEQGGAGQPATSPESKPKPESGRRSR